MKNKKSTRDVILATASNLFQRQGYHGTGVNQIIEESGAPKGSLYYHFPSGKEEIALEAINLMKNHVLKSVQEDLSEKETAVEAFHYHINQVAAVFDRKESPGGLPIGLIASETGATHPTLRSACESAYKAWQSLYADKLEEFGFNRRKAEELSLAINAMIEGACILSITNESGEPLRSIAKQMPLLLIQQ